MEHTVEDQFASTNHRNHTMENRKNEEANT